MDLGLRGHVVLVTGASGGIGSATARAFAAEGAHVVVHYHSNRAAGDALADEIGGVAVGADLREDGGADRLARAALERFGRVDACVANAGVWPSEDVPVADMPLDRWRATLDANLTATFLTARAFLRAASVGRSANGAGDESEAVPAPSIVIVGSTAGIFGEAGHADYAAAKAAIGQGLALSLKNEIVRTHPSGRVNVVAPGWTVSPMTAKDLTPEAVVEVTRTMALRKVATTDDIARAIVMLSSPVAAGHVSGQLVTVAGGMEGRLLHGMSPAAR